jgi:thioredoxin-related protein
MDAVTYPNPEVSSFLSTHVVPVKVLYNAQPLAEKFRVVWTPTLVILDSDGTELYREEGFLPPEKIVPALMLGMGKVKVHARKFQEAITYLSDLVTKYPNSEEAPEALYFVGVARFRETNDLRAMRDAYESLSKKYPKSSWTIKASPYKPPK